MVLSLNYRRPAHVSRDRLSIETEKSGAESTSSNSSCPYGIPDALSFDRIINGGTCPPVTTREFMDFLKYIEHDAENLQFFMWYRDYVRRFAVLPENERVLASEWTLERAAEAQNEREKPVQKPIPAVVASVLKGTDFDPRSKPTKTGDDVPNPFNTPPRTPIGGSNDGRDSVAPSTVGWSEDASSIGATNITHHKRAANAFEEAGAPQPFTIQPFREEITRIIAIYVAEGGARQLNLSSKVRNGLLKALSFTTHPSAFKDVVATVEWSLRHQLHPNFIRWTICNGNPPRQAFARGLGVGGIVAGIVYGVVVTLSGANRGWRALAFLLLFIGVSTLFAAWKGMCVVLHGMHHRHLRPWELFVSEEQANSDFDGGKGSFDSLGSNNSYEDEPWIPKYQKRNVIRKIFDREVWIREPALRQIQDTIFLQALITALIIGGVITAIFLAVPAGNYY